MKRLFRKIRKCNLFTRTFFKIILLAYIVSYVFFTKNILGLTGVENLIRFGILIFFILYFVFYFVFSFAKLIKRKYVPFYLVSIITIIFIVIFVCSSVILGSLYSFLSKTGESDSYDYNGYLIALNGTKLSSDCTLGMINDENDIEGYTLANEIIKDNNITCKVNKYDEYLDLLHDLYNKKLDGIFVASNYLALFGGEEGYENISSETEILYKKGKQMDNQDKDLTSNKNLSEPFTVLIMGVDSEVDGLNPNAGFNGDTLILATFNPDTYTVTLFSIPRDTYVPIACRNNKQAKINSSAGSGTSCVIDTIENLTGIDIDYYFKINFKGVVELVDALGGVDVDVQAPDYSTNHGNYCGQNMICEQNSNRDWGTSTIYITPGYQTLNGEQALAYARCRGLYASSDLARNAHQQDIILAMVNKVITIRDYNDFKNILNAISNNIITNMSTSQILSSYNILKGMLGNATTYDEFITVRKTYLETYSLPVYLSASGTYTSALGYYSASLDDIKKLMNINLGYEKPTLVKTFSYEAGEEYEAYIAGKGLRSGSTNSTLTSFIGKTKAEAKAYCDSNNLSCNFTYIDENSSYYDASAAEDTIVYQDPHQGTLMQLVNNVTFYIMGQKKLDD